MKLFQTVAACALLLAQAASAQESWLCLSDAATGFSYDEQSQEWVITRFKAGNKYLIRPIDPVFIFEPPGDWITPYGIFEFGSAIPKYTCKMGFRKTSEAENIHNNHLVCEGWGFDGSFSFSSITLNFTRGSTWGYTLPYNIDKQGYGTPLVEIGTCTPL